MKVGKINDDEDYYDNEDCNANDNNLMMSLEDNLKQSQDEGQRRQ